MSVAQRFRDAKAGIANHILDYIIFGPSTYLDNSANRTICVVQYIVSDFIYGPLYACHLLPVDKI